MSVFVLKLIAVLSMVTDHISYVLTLAMGINTPLLFNMRAVGRIAFPIYAFLLVNGFEKTRDKMAYMGRLFLFAFISQLPFSLAFNQRNYMKGSFAGFARFAFNPGWETDIILIAVILLVFFLVILKRRFQKELLFVAAALLLPLMHLELSGIIVLDSHLNVFYSLAVCFAVIWALDILIKRDGGSSVFDTLLLLAACGALMAYILPSSDYGFHALVLITALYLAKNYKLAQLAVMAGWALWMYSYSNILTIGAIAACLPVAFYNGRPGKRMKTAFYLVYPVHLAALYFIVFNLV